MIFKNYYKAEGYRQLCVAKNKMSVYYPETFFYEPSDYYIQNQTIQKIKKIQMIKKDGTIYFEDSFIITD